MHSVVGLYAMAPSLTVRPSHTHYFVELVESIIT